MSLDNLSYNEKLRTVLDQACGQCDALTTISGHLVFSRWRQIQLVGLPIPGLMRKEYLQNVHPFGLLADSNLGSTLEVIESMMQSLQEAFQQALCFEGADLMLTRMDGSFQIWKLSLSNAYQRMSSDVGISLHSPDDPIRPRSGHTPASARSSIVYGLLCLLTREIEFCSCSFDEFDVLGIS